MSRYPTMVRINRHSSDDYSFVNEVTTPLRVIFQFDSAKHKDYVLDYTLHDTRSLSQNTPNKVHQFTNCTLSGQAPEMLTGVFR